MGKRVIIKVSLWHRYSRSQKSINRLTVHFDCFWGLSSGAGKVLGLFRSAGILSRFFTHFYRPARNISSLHFCFEGTTQSQMSVWEDLKSSGHWYLPGDLLCCISTQFQMLILACFSQTTSKWLVLWHIGSVKYSNNLKLGIKTFIKTSQNRRSPTAATLWRILWMRKYGWENKFEQIVVDD